jgi:hypothetical protein
MNENRELQTLINACLARGRRPIPLPHCAICARYACENLAFEAILAIIDAMPAGEARTTATEVARQLADLPASYRQQLVDQGNFAAILDAPSWPLVRSLVIDVHEAKIADRLADPRLAEIEELTLLGYAYGGPDIPPAFIERLVDSPAFARVRKLTLHSGEIDDEGRRIFWRSAFAARLTSIEGVPYRGEDLPQSLAARTITGLGWWDAAEKEAALSQLTSSAKTPQLETLKLSGGFGGGASLLALLAAAASQLVRLRELSLSLYNPNAQQLAQLETIPLPAHARVAVNPDLRGEIFTHDCDHLHVVNVESAAKFPPSEIVTEYSGTLFEFAALQNLSPRLTKLHVIVPTGSPLDEVAERLAHYEHLAELTVVYPFTFAEAQQFAQRVAPRLRKLELVLSLATGYSTTDYKQQRAAEYQAEISPAEIWRLAHDETLSRLESCTLVHNLLEVGRAPREIQHLTLGGSAAAQAVARLPQRMPIELLKINVPLAADDVRALLRAEVFARVHRMVIDDGLSDDAMAALVSDPQLAHVQHLNLRFSRELSPKAFETLVNAPQLSGVREFDFSTSFDNSGDLFSASKLLPRLVSLGYGNYRQSLAIAQRQRLPLLRRIDESLSMSVFGDARQARRWLDAHPSTPLRARLQHFIARMYDRDDARSADEIMEALRRSTAKEIPYDDRERAVDREVTALLANVFQGEPVPTGTNFDNLSPRQQQALALIQEIAADHWWNVGFLIKRPLASYGFDFYEEKFKEFLAGELASE